MYEALVNFFTLIQENLIFPMYDALYESDILADAARAIFYIIYSAINIFRETPIPYEDFNRWFSPNDLNHLLSLTFGIVVMILCAKLIVRIFKIVINAFSYLFVGKEVYDEETNIDSLESNNVVTKKNKKIISKKRRNKNR